MKIMRIQSCRPNSLGELQHGAIDMKRVTNKKEREMTVVTTDRENVCWYHDYFM
jgi:hypothetical protein